MTVIIKVVVFLVATSALAHVSRASLTNPRSHGFHRFFAWEAILALALLNVDRWFRDPLSWHQLLSWFLLMISLFLVIHGFLVLRYIGRPDSKRDDASLYTFEKTTNLVTVGAYRYIRHPLYSSLLFLAWGILFKDPSSIGGLLALAATLFLVAAGRVEEAENLRFFGEVYRQYMKRTKMFIPYLF
jgi:protein-S-isoprenylcysteine O-methyltransferase Ste14